ncbi:hypothetical protein HMPREF0063_12817 [Aeromicrobium marinum DSM 15272]|uniref:DUF3151 domain-containing protein n=1 Tax=Aeromicrobium marinum DSM 15272 TaxID=585531 RepID=E2SFK8_9ACTN|nr:DUF3151 domain-containing protein [Aeromicrobium marinum]EFQ82109.1 hypothetical protein HMPREF0063_12817 [Aeromicrobium marinum DSM 15272]
MTNLLGEPPATLLPEDPATAAIEAGDDPRNVAALHPESPLAWATLAGVALEAGHDLEGYAFARTGYHRALDLLRRNGWKGFGPVPWDHVPNRGFLIALAVLATGSERLDDLAEAHRCREFLRESSPEAYAELV